jgi:hypothetical protein
MNMSNVNSMKRFASIYKWVAISLGQLVPEEDGTEEDFNLVTQYSPEI